MKILQLPNDGYIRSSLPKDLFDTLLIEGLKCYNTLSNPGIFDKCAFEKWNADADARNDGDEPMEQKMYQFDIETGADAEDGLYCYMFSSNDTIFQLQPSGAANLTNVTKIELELNTLIEICL